MNIPGQFIGYLSSSWINVVDRQANITKRCHYSTMLTWLQYPQMKNRDHVWFACNSIIIPVKCESGSVILALTELFHKRAFSVKDVTWHSAPNAFSILGCERKPEKKAGRSTSLIILFILSGYQLIFISLFFLFPSNADYKSRITHKLYKSGFL